MGFTADGHDIWLEERKGAEDYTILYDDTKKSKALQAVEAAVRTYVEIWFDSISDLLKEVAIVKSGKPRKQGLQSRGTDPPLYEAAYPKRSERKEKS